MKLMVNGLIYSWILTCILKYYPYFMTTYMTLGKSDWVLFLFFFPALLAIVGLRQIKNRPLVSLMMAIVSGLWVSFFPFYLTGKLNHASSPLILTTLALLYPIFKKSEQKIPSSIQLAQTLCLALYFSAGIYKWIGFQNSSWDEFRSSVYNFLAYAVGEGSRTLSAGMWLDQNLHDFLSWGWVASVGLELSAILFLFLKNTYLRIFGAMAFLFHLNVGLFFGIWFFESMINAVLIFIVLPLFLQKGQNA